MADETRLGRLRRRFGVGAKTGLGAAGAAEGLSERYGGRSINQAIDIVTGDINPKQIIKWCIILLIVFGVVIWLINVARGFAVGIEQMACGIGNINPFGEKANCDPNSQYTSLTWSLYILWEAEWYMRCLFYLMLAIIMGILLYQWGGWLFNKLMRIDLEIKKLEDWIYGFRWEGSAERDMETRL